MHMLNRGQTDMILGRPLGNTRHPALYAPLQAAAVLWNDKSAGNVQEGPCREQAQTPCIHPTQDWFPAFGLPGRDRADAKGLVDIYIESRRKQTRSASTGGRKTKREIERGPTVRRPSAGKRKGTYS